MNAANTLALIQAVDDKQRPIPAAVAACMTAYKRTMQKGDSFEAEQAYKAAMPIMRDHQSVRDFVACVAHGVLIGVFQDRESSKLLYAAQTALSCLAAKEKPCRD